MEKEIFNIINSIKPQLFWLAAVATVVFLFAIIAKGLLENVAHYYLFKSVPGLGENVKVEVSGNLGTISTITKRLIRIDLDDGNELLIPIIRWRYHNWIIRKGNKK